MPNSDGHGYSYAYTFTYGFANGDTYAPNANGNCDSDSHTDCNADSNYNSLSKSDTNAKRDDSTGARDANPSDSAYSSTASITIYEKETHCSTPTSGREHAKNFGVRSCSP